MNEQAMAVSHKASMNLRFIEREIASGKDTETGQWLYRKVRILQQMFVPIDWSTGLNEYWSDVPFVEGDFSNEQSIAPKSKGD
jgi:hypothetical protein